MKKRGIVIDFLGWLLIGLGLLVFMFLFYYILVKYYNYNLSEQIRKLFRLG